MGKPRARVHRAVLVRDLYHLGGVSGRALCVSGVFVAAVLAGVVGQFATRVVWAAAGLVACVVAVFARAAGTVGAGFVPGLLLLLPGRLLQGVFPRPALLLRVRIEEEVQRRALVPLVFAECAPLFRVHCARLFGHPHLGCLERNVVHRPCHWKRILRHRRGHYRHGGQCVPAGVVCNGLPFAAPRRGRYARPTFPPPGAVSGLSLRHLFQQKAHDVGLAEFVLGGVY